MAGDPSTGELSPGDDGPPQLTDPRSGAADQHSRTHHHAMLTSIVVIVIGGSLGCLLRWYFAVQLNGQFPNLPPGTLTANLVGGYLIGVAMAVFIAYPDLSPLWKLLIVTGFLGGLTTFSSGSRHVGDCDHCSARDRRRDDDDPGRPDGAPVSPRLTRLPTPAAAPSAGRLDQPACCWPARRRRPCRSAAARCRRRRQTTALPGDCAPRSSVP